MKYVSTRDRMRTYTAAEAIVKGISDDGGLIVPSSFPVLDDGKLDALKEMDYPERAASVLAEYLDGFSYEELLDYARKAYSRFDGDDPCPLVKVDDGLYMLELWHGPTFAFKDMALTLLPHLMVASKRKLGDDSRTLILVATSGDTGKAALEGFRDVEGTEIIVFYPADGVSAMQKRQMVTQQGSNVHVAGIKGNFDDAQTAVKRVFTDPEVIAKLKAHGIEMSSANSINWGRLAPQIAYYISAYCDLLNSGEITKGEKVNFVVPTGNFGNILAGYYAYKMGLPVNKLIVASNANNILSDFFSKGEYDINRKFFKTMSPSMDILVSSNLERLIFEATGRDSAKVRRLYDDLKNKGRFELELDAHDFDVFEAGWADEDETKETIHNFFDLDDYVLDPHTAVAVSVYSDYADETDDATPTVIVSTASPYKFACDVYNAVADAREKDTDKAVMKLSMFTAAECPDGILALNSLPVRHTKVIPRDGVKQAVYDFVLGDGEGSAEADKE